MKAEMARALSTMEISFEISEAEVSLDDLIRTVEKQFPMFKFDRTEARYESCIMAVFELADCGRFYK